MQWAFVTQQVKALLSFHIKLPGIQCVDSSDPASWERARNGVTGWLPTTHVNNPDGIPASWLQCGLDMTVLDIWGESQHTNLLFFCSALQVNKKKLKITIPQKHYNLELKKNKTSRGDGLVNYSVALIFSKEIRLNSKVFDLCFDIYIRYSLCWGMYEFMDCKVS